MTDIPVIMSAPMVKALLAGRKQMTRRLAWGKPCSIDPEEISILRAHRYKISDPDSRTAWPPSPWQRVKPGDRLWVRENFHRWRGSASGKTIVYVADDEWIDWGTGQRFKDRVEWVSPMTSSIHMPRWASRLTLVVTATKIERLQEITDANVVNEGMPISPSHIDRTVDKSNPWMADIPGQEGYGYQSPRAWFHRLWDSLHGPGAWEANPEVVAIAFTVHQRNIDQMQAAA